MPDDNDSNKRAAQIGADIKAGEEKRRADAAAEASAPIIEALRAQLADALAPMANKLGAVTSRLEAVENAASEAKARSEAAASMPPSGEDDDDDDKLEGRALSGALASVQARADAVYRAFGQRSPMPMAGERLLAYRRRLLLPLKQHSPDFKNVDLGRLDRDTLGAIEARVYADALEASKTPIVPHGELLERRIPDQSGREIVTFYGQPRAWMSAFMPTPSQVVRFNTRPD